MIPVLVWCVPGRRIVWILAFPLGSLLVAVPMGAPLIPWPQDLTAAFTIGAPRVAGVPLLPAMKSDRIWHGSYWRIS